MNAKDISDFLYGTALFINASLFVPQAIKIFINKHAANVSLITFGGFNVIQLLGLINGIYNNDYALIYGQAISLIACGMVTTQIIYFKSKKNENAK